MSHELKVFLSFKCAYIELRAQGGRKITDDTEHITSCKLLYKFFVEILSKQKLKNIHFIGEQLSIIEERIAVWKVMSNRWKKELSL